MGTRQQRRTGVVIDSGQLLKIAEILNTCAVIIEKPDRLSDKNREDAVNVLREFSSSITMKLTLFRLKSASRRAA